MKSKVSPLTISVRTPGLRITLVLLWLFSLFYLTVVRFILVRVGIDEGIGREILLWCIASVSVIMCFAYTKSIGIKRILPFIILFFAVALVYCLTALLNPEVKPFLFRDNYGVVRLFRPDAPMFAALFFLLPDDTDELKRGLTVYALVKFAFEFVFSLWPAIQAGYWVNIGSSGQEIHLQYNLDFGYDMCYIMIFFLYQAIKDKNKICYLMSFLALWCIVVHGNRGALLVPILFVGLMFISNVLNDQNKTKKILTIIAVLLICTVLLLFGSKILDLVVSVLDKAGIDSRTVRMLKTGDFSSDNGRKNVWNASIKAIKNGGLLGNGMYGDRPYVSKVHYVGYSHNIFLELLASFGILGAGISVYIIIDSIRMIFFCKDKNWREIYIIFFSISCQLLISMSLWYVWAFWAAAAVSYNYRHFQKGRDDRQVCIQRAEDSLAGSN